MSERRFEDRSRRIAREAYWEEHDRDIYTCPDCGRGEDEILGGFEVHHKNGEPMDNRSENQVGLCRLCHNLREGKKPSIEQIRHLRSQRSQKSSEAGAPESGEYSVYLAGSMDDDSPEHDTWRASVADYNDQHGVYKYTGTTPIQINSPREVTTSHGVGLVKDIAGKDMELIDDSDAIVAYFEKEEQVGTLTELVYAVTEGKPALALFDRELVPFGSPSDGVVHHHESHVYWFLINFLTGDGWNGLEADVTVQAIDSRDGIGEAFREWDWHGQCLEDGYRAMMQRKTTEPADAVPSGAEHKPTCVICGSETEGKTRISRGGDMRPACRDCTTSRVLWEAKYE